MDKWGYMFQTNLPLYDCVDRIVCLPWGFTDPRYSTPLWYKCEMISATQLLITFTGGLHRRSKHTEYRLEFYTKDQRTVIEMYFSKELFGLPAMTTTQDLDTFMSQKIMATRVGDCYRRAQ